MKSTLSTIVLCAALALPALAQAGKPDGKQEPRPASKPANTAEAAADKSDQPARPKVATSDAGRSALATAKETAGRARGLKGPERSNALETAASAYDKVAADFQGEPAVAAAAAIAAAELWRQQGSLPLAEKDYLLAAQLDAARFAQRALLGAADMQRRQKRTDEAFATYAKVIAVDPGSARAQDARLWQARLLQAGERLDDAILLFQSALESADPGAETIEACNLLALALVDKGDLDAAGRAIEHAEHHVAGIAADEDPIVKERLQKAFEGMSAKKALQRARDKQNQVGKDAARLEAERAGK
jgi:tetratricopeptide (TPR) repeat protein